MVDWVILFGKIMFSKPNLLWSSVKGAWLVRLFCKSCRIYYRVGINRTKNNILPENIFLPSMWFKKCIFVKKAGLYATRFQRFVGKVLLCKLVANTFWEPKNGIAYLRVLEISQNIVLKRNTWLLTSNPFTDKRLFWSTYLITGLLELCTDAKSHNLALSA